MNSAEEDPIEIGRNKLIDVTQTNRHVPNKKTSKIRINLFSKAANTLFVLTVTRNKMVNGSANANFMFGAGNVYEIWALHITVESRRRLTPLLPPIAMASKIH